MLGKNERFFEIEMKKSRTMLDILNLIKDKPMSIAEIGRKLKINRSTLRYYLSLLKEENTILMERLENDPGRPTMISIDKENAKKEWNLMQKKAEDYRKKMADSPYAKKILNELDKKKEIPEKEFFELTKDLDKNGLYVSETLGALNWLERKGDIIKFYKKKK